MFKTLGTHVANRVNNWDKLYKIEAEAQEVEKQADVYKRKSVAYAKVLKVELAFNAEDFKAIVKGK